MKFDVNNDRILGIVHKDLDGAGCSITILNVFNRSNVKIYSCSFSDIDRVLKNITYNDYDKVLVCDVYPTDLTLLDNPKIILLDHHSASINNPERNRFVDESVCGTKLVKQFLEKHTGRNLSYLNEMVELINSYDLWTWTDIRAWELAELYFLYWDEFQVRFRDGDLKLTDEENRYINKRKQHLETTWKNLEAYKLDKINGCFIQSWDVINEMCHRLLTEKGYDFVICRNLHTKTLSIRTKPVNIHIGDILKDLGIGGGHKFAAGTKIIPYEDLQKTIEMIEEEISKEVSNVKA